MVKLQDGSLVLAGDLLSGSAEDDEGKPLKFEQVKTATVPTFQARSTTQDGTNKIYSFSLADTNVRISLVRKTKEELIAEQRAQQEEEQQQQQQKAKGETTSTKPVEVKTEKAYKTSSPADYKKKYY